MIAITKTPVELMATQLVLTPNETALVLGLVYRKGKRAGQPKRALLSELVADQQLHPVNAKRPPASQCFAVAEVQRYLDSVNPQEGHSKVLKSVAS